MNAKNAVTALPHLDDYLLHLQTDNYSQETVYNYERDLEVFQAFLGESNIPFDRVDKKIILYYKAYLTSQDRKTPRSQDGQSQLVSFSINRMLSALRSYLKFLIDNDHPSPVPPDAVTLVKTERKHPRVGEFDDIVHLIEAPSKFEKNKIAAARNRAMLEVLFSTGLRISELIGLRLEQIDRQGRIFIRGKGKKERFGDLTASAKRHLENYQR